MRVDSWLLRTFSLAFWGKLPARFQRALSRSYALLYEKRWSRHLIGPYCRFVGMKKDYLSQFRPASGNSEYQSFQDFFTRKYKEELKPEADRAWPCEGRVCDQGWIGSMESTWVKGHQLSPKSIFEPFGDSIPDHYYFVNIFLHNNDYHRIHSPVDGYVEGVQRVKGELVVLRPKIYPEKPSLPAFRNERVNLLIREKGKGEAWFLSIIGGPAVGGIRLEEKVEQKGAFDCGEELGAFLLGSTLCMAAPLDQKPYLEGIRVTPGMPIKKG